jgi:hypothetical protein
MNQLDTWNQLDYVEYRTQYGLRNEHIERGHQRPRPLSSKAKLLTF